jgi:D-methionine transport system ATP-binding protein
MAAIIEIKNLSKTFKTKHGAINALLDINLEINESEIFGIIGTNGAGKSTLVRCMNLLERPSSGEVIFNGKNLTKLGIRSLNETRRSMGMIFQQFNLLTQKSALGNVCFPLEIAGIRKRDAEKRAMELLHLVGIKDKAQAYPSQLSGGQKQRVAIARALANNPKVLLCDEATSALDPKTTGAILGLLKDINRRFGITIVIITHEMKTVEEICGRAAILEEGRVAETGSVEDIFTHPESTAAKRLIFTDDINPYTAASKCRRIVFNGRSSFEPIIANMIMECGVPINIIFADSKNIDGKAFGEIVIQLPEDAAAAGKIISYLRAKKIDAEEIDGYV